jgi:transcriptional repressor NrdR
MICVFCGGETDVTNSRPSKKSASVWRRRVCVGCRKVFSTREKPDLSLSVRVKKKAKQEEPFSEDKLLMSVHRCLSHRKDALEASRALSDTITSLLLPSARNGLIQRQEIAKITYGVLSRFDKVAAVFYRSHHSDIRF